METGQVLRGVVSEETTVTPWHDIGGGIVYLQALFWDAQPDIQVSDRHYIRTPRYNTRARSKITFP